MRKKNMTSHRNWFDLIKLVQFANMTLTNTFIQLYVSLNIVNVAKNAISAELMKLSATDCDIKDYSVRFQ